MSTSFARAYSGGSSPDKLRLGGPTRGGPRNADTNGEPAALANVCGDDGRWVPMCLVLSLDERGRLAELTVFIVVSERFGAWGLPAMLESP